MRRRELLGLAAASFAKAADRLESWVPELMQEFKVPGLSMATVEDAKLSWHREFGVKDAASKVPVDKDTMFEAASMSKPVFAYAVMKLVERGIVDLDTPLTKYTRERFLEGDPRLDRITARHVLSHTSGFQDWRSAEMPLKIQFDPGSKYDYSGEGYAYLQSVIARLTGRVNPMSCETFERDLKVCATDIDAYMRKHVLTPLRMRSSGYLWNDTFAKQMARPHDARGEPQANRKSSPASAARYASAGALLCTPIDYTKFLIEIIEPKMLRRSTRDEMLRPHVPVLSNGDYKISWALGWRVAQTKDGVFINHGGDNTGFHCFAQASIVGKSGFVIMTNGDRGADLLQKLAPAVGRAAHSLG